ncbi:hypothetical protein V2J09_017520 [Rumex salicifolius]
MTTIFDCEARLVTLKREKKRETSSTPKIFSHKYIKNTSSIRVPHLHFSSKFIGFSPSPVNSSNIALRCGQTEQKGGFSTNCLTVFRFHVQRQFGGPPSLKLCGATEEDEENETVHLAGGNVQLVTTFGYWEQKLTEAKNNGIPVVANFSAPWCTPCRSMVPVYRELADTHPNIMFLTVDVDELADLSTSWDVKATPTFHFLRNGEPVDKLVGANKDELLKKVAALAESSPTQK